MSKKEVRNFDAEVGKVLNLMINSLYTNKEIFLRELISNASDACDKLRYLALNNASLIEEDSEFKINISLDKDNKTITIKDNGIGMNKEDMIENLGTIARSGTQIFMEKIAQESKQDLIGQFGVGFYSSYMVADEVVVISKKAGENKSYRWSSKGEGVYEISDFEGEVPRGTSITLHIKESEISYLDHFRIKHIIKTYSDHISVPIFFESENGENIQVNSSSALWTKPKSSITDDQYKDFYKSVAYAIDDPWMILHNKNEGKVEFTNLLFIPTNKTFDLFHPDRKSRVKLYIKKVFINEEGVDLIPQYLRFLRGIVDSEDLPLNISREILQHNNILEKIKFSITTKVLGELKKKKEEDFSSYEQFWQNFGAVLKEGLCEALADHEKILSISLFKSALKGEMISIDDYVANMKEGQKEIFFLSGDNAEKIKNSPQLEGFLSRGIDVLLFTDTVDDFWVNVCHEYKDHKITSVTKSNHNLDAIENQENNKSENSSSENNEILSYAKTVLGDLVKEVRISKKLTSSPVCLAVDEGAMDIRMERFLIEQKQLKSAAAKIMEINMSHPIILKLEELINSNKDAAESLVKILFDQACVIEGEPVADPSAFSKNINKFILAGL